MPGLEPGRLTKSAVFRSHAGMFGLFKRKRKSLELVPFAEGKPLTFNTLLCDGVTARNLPSFAELLAVHARLQREQPDLIVLASLDDLGQAAYTSGHCADTHALDEVEDEDEEAEFPDRLANFLKLTGKAKGARFAGVLDWETDGDSNDPVTVNADPEAALRIAKEKHVIFQLVPVSSAADAIAAFPNGYFNSDLTPMQNHALARRLDTQYGLALFGIGSRFLGFRRGEPLGDETAATLAAEIAGWYRGTPPGAADALARLIAGRDWLLLRYTES
jgi:hypothetical protein